jgi:hypothetical protein
MTDFTIKKDNTAPFIRSRLIDRNGDAANLSGATVAFNMALANTPDTLKVSAGVATIVVDNLVQYAWQAGDTDTPGLYYAEFVVTYSGGTIETFPSADWNKIQIINDLG